MITALLITQLSLYFILLTNTQLLSGIMLSVITTIGLVVLNFSKNYLDGDPKKNKFLLLISLTTALTSLMVVQENLISYIAIWVCISISLDQLLKFYPERKQALFCAQKKFLFSRLGDLSIIAAILLIYSSFGTLSISEVNQAVPDIYHQNPKLIEVIGILIAIGAMIKSAQIPFHAWLPNSLEAPTPVSALMHAGIINAGGFLIIRLSQLASFATLGNGLMIIVGSLTACYGMSCMITQTSVKKRLAYSTLGQMGFMILQCGLGLYSLALLHIVAHSFYKAYAFLTAGTAIEQGLQQNLFPTLKKLSVKAFVTNLVLIISFIFVSLIFLPQDKLALLPISLVWIFMLLQCANHAFSSIKSKKISLLVSFSTFGFTLLSYLFFSNLSIWATQDILANSWISLALTGKFFVVTACLILLAGYAIQMLSALSFNSSFKSRIFVDLFNGLYSSVNQKMIKKIKLDQLKNKDLENESHISTQLYKETPKLIAPTWSLQDYIAVNPFLGFSNLDIKDADQIFRKSLGASILNYDQNFADSYLSFAEYLDRQNNSNWNDLFREEIAKFCSLYFDAGQAVWVFPLKQQTLYKAWKNYASLDQTLNYQGIDILGYLNSLPEDFQQIFVQFSKQINLNDTIEKKLLFKQSFNLKGWLSYVRHLVFEDEKTGIINNQDQELLAIILSYELALLNDTKFKKEKISYLNFLAKIELNLVANYENSERNLDSNEAHFLKTIQSKLQTPKETQEKSPPLLQAIFCIDVRSEGFRRALEAQDPRIETYGFAGFFGISGSYKPFRSKRTFNQFPALLSPNFKIFELPDKCCPSKQFFTFKSEIARHLSSLIKTLRQSVSSGFGYVESLGVLYVKKMFGDTFCIPSKIPSQSKLDLNTNLSFEDKLQFAKKFFKFSSLQFPLANFVMLCGHESATRNNPIKAGLECGACGGHSGRVNVKIACQILNDSQIREQLLNDGYHISSETRFIPAIHVTTTDQILILEENPRIQSDLEYKDIKNHLNNATLYAQKDRLKQLSKRHRNASVWLTKSNDWSDVRPEWGLARNAALIVARRERTYLQNLENRCFLHEYDHKKDLDLSILELIISAPMVVASWINLQYFASAALPKLFSSGNKVIQNVTGQLGVVLGNGGDLQIGLPHQSVHTGSHLFHEPLRLQVIIEATEDSIIKVLERNEMPFNLVKNNWIKIFALDPESNKLKSIVLN